jgi:predicted amidohydrolase YtcJ
MVARLCQGASRTPVDHRTRLESRNCGLDKRFPTAADLDVVVADRPVWLIRADGHAGWANSGLALAAGKVTAATKDPAGGRIERVAGTARQASGILDRCSPMRWWTEGRARSPVPRTAILALARRRRVLLGGVTAIADMGTSIEDWQAYRRAGDTSATCASASWPMPPGWMPWN